MNPKEKSQRKLVMVVVNLTLSLLRSSEFDQELTYEHNNSHVHRKC